MSSSGGRRSAADRNSRRREYSRSRSRSRSRQRSERSSRRSHSRSTGRHCEERPRHDRREHAGVKREDEQSFSSHAKTDSSVKHERGGAHASAHSSAAQAAARSGAAAHASRPVASVSSSGVKTENEPSEADVIAALRATAAAAAPKSPTQSATSASAAPAVVPVSQQAINYGKSGLLAAAANTGADGVVRGYQEPVDAARPEQAWRLYVFKDGVEQDHPLRIHTQSMYLIGRDEKACDLPVLHPSCSKQHAVIQFRRREVQLPDGDVTHTVKPYVMDLASTNGTFLAGVRREPHRYYELLDHDILKFGCSTRDYVLINTSLPTAAKAPAAAN